MSTDTDKKNGDDKSNARRRSRSPRDRRGGGDRDDPQDRRVYVSNIPYEVKWMNLKDICKEKVGEVAYVELYDNDNGKPKGCGVVEFKRKEDAKKAVEILHQYEISGRKIMVREERETDRRRLEREAIPQSKGGKRKMDDRDGGRDNTPMMGGAGVMGNNPMSQGGNNQWQGLISAVPPKILQSIGVDPQGPLSSTLFISNLDYKVKWKHLHDIFSMAGKVVTGEMKLDDDGKSRGMAVVQMDNPLEAIQAISMFNNQMLFERKISCRMDRYDGNDPKKGDERRNKGGMPEGLKQVGMGLGAGGTVVNIGRLLEEQRQQQNMMSTMSGMGGLGGASAMGGLGGMGMMMNGGMSGGMSGMGAMSSLGGGFGSGFGSGSGGMSGLADRGLADMRGLDDRMGRGDSLGMSSFGGGAANSSMPGLSNDFRSSSLGAAGNGGGSLGGGGGVGGFAGMRDFSNGLGDMRNSPMSSGLLGAGGPGILDSFNRPAMMGGADRGRDGLLGGLGGGGGHGTGGKEPDSSIFVRNLPFSMNWQDLKDKFRCVGDVRYAEIKQKDGKSMGCGVVRFGSKDEAQKAIELFDRTRVEGREIEVRLDRA